MGTDTSFSHHLQLIERTPHIRNLMAELQSGLTWYFETAGRILKAYGIRLKAPGASSFSLQKNFFSILFLYSYSRVGIPSRHRILYAATLQCLRGMVTACDNLLDDEYKETLDTDIPATGYRFRSVVDIMVSDRVLFHILVDAAEKGAIPSKQVLPAMVASMKTMTRSGVEEASEEAGITEILEPESVIKSVHHLKTGTLFQCPWDIPLTIESIAKERLAPLLEGLYRIGIGCQIMDDMVDMANDIQSRRHNYMVSLIHHGSNRAERRRLADRMHPDTCTEQRTIRVDDYPIALTQASEVSNRYLRKGLSLLFSSDDQILVTPAIDFLERRIGISRFVRRSAS